MLSMKFVPTIESNNTEQAFISEPPYQLMSEGKFTNKVPYLTGFTESEGALYIAECNCHGFKLTHFQTSSPKALFTSEPLLKTHYSLPNLFSKRKPTSEPLLKTQTNFQTSSQNA
jgi:hypothetical protein